MPYCAGAAETVRLEIARNLVGCRVSKLIQPTKSLIVVTLSGSGIKSQIVIDINPSTPKVYISESEYEAPAVPPMLCTVLRKHLSGARLDSVRLLGFDRVIALAFTGSDDLGYDTSLTLIVECVRGQSNVILTRNESASSGNIPRESASSGDVLRESASSEIAPRESASSGNILHESASSGNIPRESESSGNALRESASCGNVPRGTNSCGDFPQGAAPLGIAYGKIITASQTNDITETSSRHILPGFSYTPHAQDRIDPLTCTETQVSDAFAAEDCDSKIAKSLVKCFQGMAPVTAREIAYRAARDVDAVISSVSAETLSFHFCEFFKPLREGVTEPTLIFDKDDPDKLIDFTFFNPRQYGSSAGTKSFADMSSLISFFYDKQESENRVRQKANDLFKILANTESRLTKKLRQAEIDLAECAEKDRQREFGELITANIYRLKDGADEYSVEDFYHDSETITISADKRLSPAKNAQRFFKRYQKLRTAETHIAAQIDQTKNDIIYVDSVFESLTRAVSDRDIAEIRDEFTDSGLVSRNKTAPNKSGKKAKILPLGKPDSHTAPSGAKVLCGRNNRQNDALTFKTATRADMWFHVRNIPGSHVILFCGAADPDAKDIEFAAKIAAANSKGKNMPICSVDFTRVRSVKKPTGAKPGFVTYANFQTISVKTDNR
ncbi:hypothetical protein FACS1894219_10360 [Clostridia bacterium]|nr:hypothetical protein FACS1894219_10360 [Clostridia bacterium]